MNFVVSFKNRCSSTVSQNSRYDASVSQNHLQFVLDSPSEINAHDSAQDVSFLSPHSKCKSLAQLSTSSCSPSHGSVQVEITILDTNLITPTNRALSSPVAGIESPSRYDSNLPITIHNVNNNSHHIPTSIDTLPGNTVHIEFIIHLHNGAEAPDSSVVQLALHNVSLTSPITTNNVNNNPDHPIPDNNLDDNSTDNVGTVSNLVSHTTSLQLNKTPVEVVCVPTYLADLQSQQSHLMEVMSTPSPNCAADSEVHNNNGLEQPSDHNDTHLSLSEGSAILPPEVVGDVTNDQLPTATPSSESPHHVSNHDGSMSSSHTSLPVVVKTTVSPATATLAPVPLPTDTLTTTTPPPPSDTSTIDTVSGSTDIVVKSMAALEFIREPRRRCNTLDPKARSYHPHYVKRAKPTHHSSKNKSSSRSDTRSSPRDSTRTTDSRSCQLYGWFLLPLSSIPYTGVRSSDNSSFIIPTPPPLPNNWSPRSHTRHVATKTAAPAPVSSKAVKAVKPITASVNTQQQPVPSPAPQDNAPHSNSDSVISPSRKTRSMARCRAWRLLCEARTRVDKT